MQMQALKLLVFSRSPLYFQYLPSNDAKLSISLFSSLSSPTQIVKPNGNSHLADYLVNTFKFTKTQAFSISSRFSWVTSLEKPQSVYSFLQELGFSDTHIRSAVRVSPQILFSNIDKTLRPKLEFFQQLGLFGSDLARFIAKNSTLLTASLDRKLVPCIEILKKILGNDENAKDLIRVLHRCNWVVTRDPKSRLLGNIAFMESCGIVGSQLSTLLKRQPWLFIVQESVLRSLVARVVEMGFSLNSGMLVHGLYTVSCLRNGTISRKLDLLRGFGFSEDECMDMFRRTPGLLRTSEEKLKFGIDFFLNTVKFKKSVLIHTPWILMYSMENRVSARYRILEVIKSKQLLKRDPSFYDALILPENEFLDKFISRFRGDAEELLVTYKARLLDSTDEEDS
ncbi:hypothetical protein ACFX1T_026865 [Malus domestica]